MPNYRVELTLDTMPATDPRQYWYALNPASDTAIVFVHGILSSNRACWLHEDAKTGAKEFWPDLIKRDARFQSPSVFMGGFYTELGSGDYSVRDGARELYSALSTVDSSGNPPPLEAASRIVFVCHSTGGILVPRMLTMESRAFEDKAIGLALMATPTLGSRWANLISPLAWYYNQQLALRLREGDREVELIRDDFKKLRNDGHLPYLYGMEACENEMLFRKGLPRLLKGILPNRLSVVPMRSAGVYFDTVRLAGTDHSSAVKPSSLDHPANRFLADFIATFRRRVTLPLRAARISAPSSSVSSGPLFAPTGAYQQELPPHVTSEFRPFPIAQSSVAAQQAAVAKPRIDELFEIITEPDDVLRAIFRAEKGSWLAPYEVDYVGARDGLPDVRVGLDEALRAAGRRLIVRAPQGVGKTREIAELARLACADRNWTVLVARSEADARLGAIGDVPPELINDTLLVVIDNLHTKVIASEHQPKQYLARLDALLQSLEAFRPGKVWLLAALSDEPDFQRQLGLPRNGERWNDCGLFRLPSMTQEGLQQVLVALAARAGAPVTADEASKLVQNSDRKPETIFLNVCQARRKAAAIAEVWQPTEGESWKQRFATVRSDNAGVVDVCRAVDLLIRAGVPARTAYVASVSRALGERDPEAAIETLVGESLLGLRQEKLAPFGEEQLKELLEADAASSAMVLERADVLATTITDANPRPNDWADDLMALSSALIRSDAVEKAEEIATRVIKLQAGGAKAFRLRASIRMGRGNLAGAESDFSVALAITPDDPELYFVRGSTRSMLAKFDAAIEDAYLAVKYGKDDKDVHGLLGNAFYQQAKWNEADSAITTSVAKGNDEGMTFFARAMARYQILNYAGAEEDLTAAIARGIDLETSAREIQQIEVGFLAKSADELRRAPAKASTGKLIAHTIRGLARFAQRKLALAEEDFTTALSEDFAKGVLEFTDAIRKSSVPMFANLRKQYEESAVGPSPAMVHHVRGMARMAQEKHVEAIEDFDAALAAGYDDPEVYYGRAAARVGLVRSAEGLEDINVAIERGKADAFAHSIRGLAYLQLSRMAEATQDFSKAIELGRADHLIYLWRAAARASIDPPGAAADIAKAMEGRAPDAMSLFIRGCVYADLGRPQEGEEDLNAAIAMGFANPVALMVRGIARFNQRKWQEADEDLTTAFEKGAINPGALSARAVIRIDQSRFADAETDLTAAMNLGRSDGWAFYTRGIVRQALGEHATAEEDFTAGIAAGSTDAEILLDRADARGYQGKWSEALGDLDAAIAAGRDDARVHFARGQALRAQSKLADAEIEVDLALARDDQPSFRGERGYVRLLRGNLSGAQEDFDAALDEHPNDARLVFLRGLSRYAQRQIAEALADYDAALAMDPTNKNYIQYREFAHLRLGAVDKAVADWQQLENIEKGADTLGALGVIGVARGDFEDAVQRFTAAAEEDESWSRWRGFAFIMTGKLGEAVDVYKKGLLPSDDPLDLLLAREELDFYASRYADRLASAEAQAAVAAIKQELEARYRAAGGIPLS